MNITLTIILYSERGECYPSRRGDQYNSLHHTKAGRIHNLFYSGIPLIWSPMGMSKLLTLQLATIILKFLA